jgi:hypothetical protein
LYKDLSNQLMMAPQKNMNPENDEEAKEMCHNYTQPQSNAHVLKNQIFEKISQFEHVVGESNQSQIMKLALEQIDINSFDKPMTFSPPKLIKIVKSKRPQASGIMNESMCIKSDDCSSISEDLSQNFSQVSLQDLCLGESKYAFKKLFINNIILI